MTYRFAAAPSPIDSCTIDRRDGTHRLNCWPDTSTSGCLPRCRGNSRMRCAIAVARAPAETHVRPIRMEYTRQRILPPVQSMWSLDGGLRMDDTRKLLAIIGDDFECAHVGHACDARKIHFLNFLIRETTKEIKRKTIRGAIVGPDKSSDHMRCQR